MKLPHESNRIRDLRERCHQGEEVFWANEQTLCVFAADAARKASADNFADLNLPDKLADVIRGKEGEPFSWQEIRSAWFSQLRELMLPDSLEKMLLTMQASLERQLDTQVDLVWAIQKSITSALLPTVIAQSNPRDLRILNKDQNNKLAFLLDLDGKPRGFWQRWHSQVCSIRAASVARREINARAKGKRARQADLLDPLVDMLPRLGLDRAVDAVSTVLTAITGPPGAAAVCLVYELLTRPQWHDRLSEELSKTCLHGLLHAPFKSAPVSYRFVKEVLRMWNVPMLVRDARTEFQVGSETLNPGQLFISSPYFIHRHPDYWRNPNEFDPERWLPGAEHGQTQQNTYVPFGWAPKTCVGSQLGLYQLMMMCYLVCTRFDIRLSAPEKIAMEMAALPQPRDFYGVIRQKNRAGSR